jgi:hypothetical protein
MKNGDLTAAIAALDPVPSAATAERECLPERELTLSRIRARRRRARTRSALVAAAVLAIALAIPALAVSGRLVPLFGFSNPGTSVDERTADLRTASALVLTGTRPGTLRLLASRGGVGVYIGRGERDGLCLFLGPPDGRLRGGLSGGCMAVVPAGFPSPQEPVIDTTLFAYRPGEVGEQVVRLAGIAADGVAKVQVLGIDCRVVAETPVVDNVYVADDLPSAPAVAIEALDKNGNRVFLDRLRFWDDSACARAAG